MEAIRELTQISHYAGMREDLVQAGGGNTSVKVSTDRMLIKASGYQLADVTAQSGYSAVNYRLIADFFKENQDRSLTEEMGKQVLEESLIEGRRPSIETFLHAITDVLTLHTHPIAVNILAMRRDGMVTLKELFPDALIVGYKTPGVRLAQEYFCNMLQSHTLDSRVIFLQNHGMIVTGKAAEEVIERNEKILQKIEDYLSLDMKVYHNSTALWYAFCGAGQDGIIWTVADTNVLRTYHDLGGIWHHEFCPDCLVYCGKKMLRISDCENVSDAIRRHLSENGPISIVEWKNALYIHAPSVKKAMEIQSVLSFSAQVVRNNISQKCDLLSDEEQNFLLHWDAEKYRQTLQN